MRYLGVDVEELMASLEISVNCTRPKTPTWNAVTRRDRCGTLEKMSDCRIISSSSLGRRGSINDDGRDFQPL